jgi:polyphosphate kinase
MPRNLYNRVELVTPVLDPKLRAELVDVLDRSFADNTNSWELHADGGWERRQPNGQPRNLQRELIELHQAKAASGAEVEAPG